MTNNKPAAKSPDQIAQIIEALLFVADHPVAVSELTKAIEVTKTKVEKALALLEETYQTRGLRIQRSGTKVQLVTAAEMTEYVEAFLGLNVSSKLSMAALEVLGILAYKQPLTRAGIEAIRGVNCDGVLRTLLSKGLVEEVGRLDTVGHPIQYGTTFEFLQYFGITSLDELPELEMDSEDETMLSLLDDVSEEAETLEDFIIPDDVLES